MPLDADRIRKTGRKLRKMMKKFPKQPAPEKIHDLRTSIRRFEASVDALDPNPKRSERRLLRDLARIRRRAGKIRDMDVLTADATSVRVPKEQDCSVQLVQYLGAQRYKHVRRLRAALRKDGARIGRKVKRLSDRLAKRIPDSANNSANGHLEAPPEAIAAAVELSTELTTPRNLNHNNLHPYRLKVKELRDVLLLADKPANPQFVDILGKVKDAIGDWHDWEELVAIASDVLDHGADCKLLQKLKDISRDKYQHAMSITQKMRKRYLLSRDRKRLVCVAAETVAA